MGKKCENGQSVVEYLLMLLIVGLFMNVVFNSKYFKALMGPDSNYFQSMASYLEVSYRYPFYSAKIKNPNLNGVHESYADQANSSRFWGPKSAE